MMAGGARAAPHTTSTGSAPTPEPEPGLRIEKFRLDAKLGEGGQGLVFLATDTELSRLVALKILRPELAEVPELVQRFLAEAKRTSALAHSGIPSIFEFGTSREGLIYFAMELIHGPTLWDILDGLRREGEAFDQKWPLDRLIRILSGAARALHYAHTRGLVHRDIKPANVSLGRGEDTLVLDWGLAKRFREDQQSVADAPEENVEITQMGRVMGTPLYLSPEQAFAGACEVDPRTDVFALGALLYEVLCLDSPYAATTAGELLRLARSGDIEPPSSRRAEREIPAELESIAMRALSKNPDDRQQTAEQFAEELEEFLMALQARASLQDETSGLLRSAVGLAGRFQRLRGDLSLAEAEAAQVREAIPEWAPIAQKTSLWSAEARVDVLRLDVAETLSSAVETVTRCLLQSPRDTRAQRLSETLYAAHLEWAESLGDWSLAASACRRLKHLHETTPVHVRNDLGRVVGSDVPREAVIEISRWEECDRRLVERTVKQCSPVDLEDLSLPAGSYVFTLTIPDCAAARMPIIVRRGEVTSIGVRRLPQDQVPDGFAWVPAGPFLCGRRPQFESIEVPDFAIQRSPVVIDAYIDWLDHLHAEAPEEAERRVPRVPGGGPLLVVVDGRHVARSTTEGGASPARPPAGHPVVGICRSDAEAYAAWLGERIGTTLRLPTEIEWEKAARGADARQYPWGSHLDVTFCAMASSTGEPATLRPVAMHPVDASPYGVLDCAGGVSDWCGDAVGIGGTLGVHRGGSWLSHRNACHVLMRKLLPPESRAPDVGFRLVAEL